MSSPSSIYLLKVTLAELKPSVWRRLEVAGDIALDELHLVLQAVMGWTNSHLHQFVVGETRYLQPDPTGFDDAADDEDERLFTLAKIAPRVKKRFVYEYDFGDSWTHTIEVERIFPPEPGATYPRCTAGARACPPEDSGGPWGYPDLLKALANRKHPEHASMVKWTGGKFDPEAFDLDRVNATFARSRRARRTRGSAKSRTVKTRSVSKRKRT